jgi:predicted component of type VI protein secretion system
MPFSICNLLQTTPKATVMAVEINILSGVRQGQRLVLDATKLRAGPDPNCEIYFDPLADSAARDRSVALSLMDDGWYIQSTGQGEVFVNQSPVVGLTRIKSGSIVRMSEFGPEFEFRILARVPSPAAQPATPGFTSEIAPSMPDRPAQPAAVPSMPAAPVGASLSAAPLAAQEPARPSAPAASARDSGRLAVMVGFGILACLMLLVLAKLMSTPTVPPVVVLPPPTPAPAAPPAPAPQETPVPGPSPTPTPAPAPPILCSRVWRAACC